MNYCNRCTNPKRTREELEQELKNDRISEHELDDTQNYPQIKAIMYKIEYLRSERQKKSPGLTQKKLAEKAGIGLSTYTGYLSGASDNISVKTVLKIADALGCKPSDLIDKGH